MKTRIFNCFTILMVAIVSVGFVSCDNSDESDNTNNGNINKGKTRKECLLGTWNFSANTASGSEEISITFFENGTYADHDHKYNNRNIEGYYILSADSITFIEVQSVNYKYKKSVKILELTDNTLLFEGQNISYDGIFRGTKERNIDEKTSERFRKDIIGDWILGTDVLSIKDNGNFEYTEYYKNRSHVYKGVYDICDDKILLFEETQKCGICGLYVIKMISGDKLVMEGKYELSIPNKNSI